mgnify:CR=1 FL=1
MIKITIPGSPIGKGRPKFSTFGGYPKAYTPQKTVNYENLVKLSYQQQCNDKPYPKEISLRAEIRAYFAIPKSVSKIKRDMMLKGQINPTKKPDTDNIAKAILDALNGIAYYDDAQIVALSIVKMYSDEPRAEVCISTL